jgi:hypothetical protein
MVASLLHPGALSFRFPTEPTQKVYGVTSSVRRRPSGHKIGNFREVFSLYGSQVRSRFIVVFIFNFRGADKIRQHQRIF